MQRLVERLHRGRAAQHFRGEGVDPITPDEVADCIMFALTRPLHVNVDEIVIKALQQSSGARIVRRTDRRSAS